MSLKSFNQAGETIIEVMISLAVLGLTLGLSYGIAGRSLRGAQDAQERTGAFQYSQSIIETIKAYASRDNLNDPDELDPILFPLPYDDKTFCVNTASIEAYENEEPSTPADPDDSNCRNGIYTSKVTTTRLENLSGGLLTVRKYRMTVDITWEAISGNGTNNVQMIYGMSETSEL
jgi:Tfp pilus assembly protein PilV